MYNFIDGVGGGGWNNAVGFVECEVIPRKDDDSWNESDYDVCHWSIG